MFSTASRFVCLHCHLPTLAYFINKKTKTITQTTQEKLGCETHYSSVAMTGAGGRGAASAWYILLGCRDLHLELDPALGTGQSGDRGHRCATQLAPLATGGDPPGLSPCPLALSRAAAPARCAPSILSSSQARQPRLGTEPGTG